MLILKNANILMKGKLAKKHIIIENNKIKKISSSFSSKKDAIDLKGKIVIPGLIDSHVHMREPGFEYKEDFYTGSRAAAAGGVTTFLDMPNTNPPTITLASLQSKRELAKKSIVNFGFHFGSLGDNISEIESAWKDNIASVKVYMDETTGRMIINDDKKLKDIFSHCKIVATHAEDTSMENAFRISKSAGNKLYLCHLSLKKEMDFLRKNRTKSTFAEVTPHHLFLTEKNRNEFNTMKPPLKSEADQKALWQAIKDGIVDTVATDHAPHTSAEKAFEKTYGVPGVETMLPLLLDAVNKKMLKLEDVARLTSQNPAKIFGIENRGKIEAGFYADLTVIDMNMEKTVQNSNLFTKCGWSPFDGWKLKGWPTMTIANGNIVFDNGEMHNFAGEEVTFKR